MSAPKIAVRIFEEKQWISLDDHKMDVQRYKDANAEKDRTILKLQSMIISLQSNQKKDTDPFGGIFDGIFGGKPKG
jgi:hypothetical protein